MTILVQNLTNETKQICRFGGTKLFILPYNFVTFECFTNAEISFWSKQSIVDNSKNGIKVIADISEISKLIKLRNAGKLPKGKITDNTEVEKPVKNVENVVETPIVAEPIIEVADNEVQTFDTIQEAEPITEELKAVDVEDALTTDNVDTVESSVETYTKEYLETLTKAELQLICNEKGITYKKNHSVNTLISLILSE